MPPEVWHAYRVCSVDEDEKTSEDERIRKEVVFSPKCSRQRAAFGECLTAFGAVDANLRHSSFALHSPLHPTSSTPDFDSWWIESEFHMQEMKI